MQTKMSRTTRGLLIATLALSASVLLAACGSDLGGGGNDGDVTTAEATGTVGGELVISQWPFYIDRKTVPEFEQDAGVEVNYIEDVNDNNEIFAKLRPDLSSGQSADRSIMVLTDWMAKKMYDLGYLQNFDKSALDTAYANLRPAVSSPAIDPDRSYTLPWQSGLTGLVVNKAQAPDVKSINDLFDPKYKGKVEMLTEMRDTVPLVMKADGIDPANATTDDWLAAIEKIRSAAKSGQIRKFTGNNYTNDLANGDAVAVIGWSGDAVQLQADDPNIEFVMPTEGCMLWSDNMVIPVGAPNPTAAYEWMNYVFEPQNQAQITAYNNYVQPVEGVKEIFEQEDPALAKSELVFPSDEYTANCSTQDEPPGGPEVVQDVEREFQSVITG